MEKLTFYNSLSHWPEEFKPIEEGKVVDGEVIV